MKEINIWWEGPFTQENIVENEISSKKYDNKATDIGLYQVYSSHPLYGADVLVYIGMTVDKGGFQSRLKNRWVIEDGNDSENVKIYLGKILSDTQNPSKNEKENMIINAEALLINALKPAYNSSYINSVGKKITDLEFQINNLNNFRSLYPQLLSSYFWNDFINIQIVDKMAKKLSIKVENKDEFYGFDLESNDNVFFGVDYNIWNAKNIPLVIGIYKDSIKDGKTLINSSEFTYVDKDKNYYYISIFANLKDEKSIDNIKEELDKVVKFIERYSK